MQVSNCHESHCWEAHSLLEETDKYTGKGKKSEVVKIYCILDTILGILHMWPVTKTWYAVSCCPSPIVTESGSLS